jgi:dipeptidyl-peptidase 4
VGETYPHQYARTRRFTCGEPRSLQIAGRHLFFLRSASGDDPVNRLWALSLTSPLPAEQLLVDPAALLSAEASDDLPPAERARRERLRESAGGITAYSLDADGRVAAFTLAGQLFLVDVASGSARHLDVAPGAYEARLSPNGRFVAYLADGALRVIGPLDLESEPVDRIVAGDHDPDVTWGAADFIASEEFDRYRGYWWSPDSTRILAERVDNTPVKTWWISDPAHPERPAVSHRYPAAGTTNAALALSVFTVPDEHGPDDHGSDEHRLDIELSADRPYLLHADWTEHGIVVVTLDRAQRFMHTYRCADDDPATVTLIHEDDDDVWVELLPGTPTLLDSTRLLMSSTSHSPEAPDGTKHITMVVTTADRLSTSTFTPQHLQMRSVVGATADAVIVHANASDPVANLDVVVGTEHQVIVEIPFHQSKQIRILAGASNEPGHHSVAAMGQGSMVIRSADLNQPGARHRVVVDNVEVGELVSLADKPVVTPSVTFLRAGIRRVPVAVLLPSDPAMRESGASLPVLVDPYGGPHHQRVISSYNAHLSSQWFADQGFAVVVVDGRGVPGPGPLFEQAVHLDLAGPVLADQVVGLLDAAAAFPQLDLSRVGIKGWSFGGYLAALAVLQRPDVFHCAVAGAPVTDWTLYDTGYTERYLGNPTIDSKPYARTSLIPMASQLSRPLMLIHGLADDNVVAAHTLRLSSALLAAGKPHEVLPLSGVTHMTPQPEVAEHLQMLQLDFFRRHLGGPGV